MHLLSKWEVLVDAFRQNQSLVPAIYEDSQKEPESNNMALALIDDDSAEEHISRRAERRKKKELEWSKVKEPSNPIALRAVEEY